MRSVWAQPAVDLSGFRLGFVGFYVGFLGLPDMNRPRGINGLSPKCRVCRVLVGGESLRDFQTKNARVHRVDICRRDRKDWRREAQPASILDSSWTPNRRSEEGWCL